MSNLQDASVHISRTPQLTQRERRAISMIRCWAPLIEEAAATARDLAKMVNDDLTAATSDGAVRFKDNEVCTIMQAIKCCNDLTTFIAGDLIDASAEVRS